MPRKNVYDWFIILVLASFVFGSVGIGLISHSVVVGLMSIPFALKEVMTSFYTARFKNVVLFLMLWLFYAIVSMLWTIAPSPISLYSLIILFCNMAIFLALFHCSRYANFSILSFMQGWLLLLLLTFPIAFWEISTGEHLEKWGDFSEGSTIALASGGSQQRVYAAVTYRNLNTYVTLLCMVLPMALAAIFELKYKIYPICIVFVAVCMVLINSSRGGMLCVGVDLFLFLCFYRKACFPYKKLVSFLLVVAIVFFIVNFGFLLVDQLFGRLESQDSFLEDAGRWDLLQLGYQLLLASGGFGWGVGSMVHAYQATGYWLHYAHNLVMEFWVQYGLFLSIPFGWLLFKVFWTLSMRSKIFSLKVYGWLAMCSFLPVIIINDSYFMVPYVWGYLATLFSMYQLTLYKR